jgi:hypothetical protein
MMTVFGTTTVAGGVIGSGIGFVSGAAGGFGGAGGVALATLSDPGLAGSGFFGSIFAVT